MTVYDRPFGRYLEDFVPGDIYRHWPGKTITEYDDHLFCMITMNHHPLHTNAWFAEHETVQGKNVVVGNLVYSLALGMSVPDVSGSCIANLEVESLLHRSPTFHGDTIYAETRVLDATPSKSKDDRGIVTVETKAFNQRGEEVCYFRRKLMVWKAAAAPERQRPYGDDAGTDSRPLRADQVRRFRRRLLEWGAENRRDLPWRSTRDPWRILVSEVMLQQTQADRVVPHYDRFLAAYPTPAACAAAGSAAVVRSWSGLGLQPAGAEPAPGGDGRRGRSRRRRAARGRGPAGLARRRALHSTRGAHVRLRRRRGRRRHQRRARPGPRGGGRSPHVAPGHGPRRPARARRRLVGVQPGDVRPGRHRVHCGTARLRAVPPAPAVRLAP